MSRISQTIAINKKTGPFRSELNTLIIYIYICIYKCGGRVYLGIKCSMLSVSERIKEALSDERLGVKLRVTENRCVFFDSFTCIYIYVFTYIYI